MRALVAATILSLLPLAAQADDAPPPAGWTEEVVVAAASSPGPALWHLTKGEAKIWILATVEPLPEGLKWDATRLGDVINGAREVLLPPQASVGLFGGLWFYLTDGELLRMPKGQSLEASLPADLRSRFVAARQAIHQDAGRYGDDAPVIAAFKLQSDFNDFNKLSAREPEQTIEHIARAHGVRVHRLGDYDAMPMLRELLKLQPEAAAACIADALDGIAGSAAHARPAADAWADGEVKLMEANYVPPAMTACLGQAKSFGKTYQRSVADATAIIDKALATPGKTVMVLDLGSLLRNSGVVDKLRAEGVRIEGPAQ